MLDDARSGKQDGPGLLGYGRALVGTWVKSLLPSPSEAVVPPDLRDMLAGRAREAWAWLWLWRNFVVAGLAVAVALWAFGTPVLYGPVVTVEPVIRADFVQSVVASGNVLAPFRVNVGSQITGTVTDVPVAEGQTVAAGETLVVLDDREATAAVVQAEGAVAQAEARMRQIKELTLPSAEAALTQAKATLVDGEAAYVRAEKLAHDGFGTKATLDDATKALEIARAQVRAAEFLVYTNRPGGSDHVMAETQLNQSRANLVSAQSRLSYTVIKAPRAGVLISRNVERGYIVQPSNVLMVLSPSGDTQLQVNIDEKNFGLLGIGQKAIASTDAFPKDHFEAEIVYINPGIDIQRATVQVKLRVADPPAYLRQDMTVSIDIETARRPAALVVPSAAVHGIGGAAPWVMRAVHGRAARQPVTVGLVSAGKAEIVAGLNEGDLVLTGGEAVADGRAVRPQLARAQPS